MRKTSLLIIVLLAITGSTPAQSLQIDRIMMGERFVGFLPQNPYWSPDGQTIFFSWNPDQELLRSTYAWHAATGIRKLTAEELTGRPSSNLHWSKDGQQAVYARHGDIFLWDKSSESTLQLTNTLSHESNPSFGGSTSKVVYRSGQNLFLHNLDNGTIHQLSDLRKGIKKSDPTLNKQDAWLKKDQKGLSTILQERAVVRKARKERAESTKPSRPKTVYMGKDRVSGLRNDPSLQYISWVRNITAKTKSTQVPNYVTESGYTSELNGRPKVGHDQGEYRFQCYDRIRDTILTLQVDSLPGIFAKPAFTAEYHKDSLPWSPNRATPKAVIYHNAMWTDQGMALLEIKSLDNKDRWIVVYNPKNNSTLCVDHQHDDAWIGGPGISGWTSVPGNFGWIREGQSVWFQSERSGYSHLYSHNLQTGKTRALTSGEFEILSARLSRDQIHLLYPCKCRRSCRTALLPPACRRGQTGSNYVTSGKSSSVHVAR